MSDPIIPTLEVIERLALAGGLGALLGAEREWRQKDAGLRTNTLIAIGSAVFTMVSIELAGGDPNAASRIPSQVASGVGFIGGGAILHGRSQKHGVQGLTTAATIWVNAAIGMAAGAGAYRLAAIASLTVLAVLLIFLPVQRAIERKAEHDAGKPMR